VKDQYQEGSIVSGYCGVRGLFYNECGRRGHSLTTNTFFINAATFSPLWPLRSLRQIVFKFLLIFFLLSRRAASRRAIHEWLHPASKPKHRGRNSAFRLPPSAFSSSSFLRSWGNCEEEQKPEPSSRSPNRANFVDCL